MRGDEKDLGRSLPWFVFIGGLIGAVVALIDCGVSKVMPALPTSVATVFALVAVSKALHLDGLADTADGFFSSRPRERILEIMRDSHIGTMGVAAVVFVLLMKVAALASIDPAARVKAVFLMPVAGRFAPVLMFAAMKYARGESGLGTVFSKNSAGPALAVSLALFAAAGYGIAGMKGLVIAGAVLVFSGLFAAWSGRKIGGYTGDTLGASVEMSELAAAVAALVIFGTKGAS